MRPELKDLVDELQMAFNESVCESDRIAEVLADIKRSGYEVVLALDVTIGVSAAKPDEEAVTATSSASSGELSLNDEDRYFLQDLHIAAE